MSTRFKTIALMFYSGLGFESGALAWRGTLESSWPPLAIVFVTALFLLEPLNDRARRLLEGQRNAEEPHGSNRTWFVPLLSALILLVFVVVHGGSEKWAEEHSGQATIEFVAALVLVGGVVFAWRIGARTRLPTAALLGFSVAFVLEVAPVLAIEAVQNGRSLFTYPEPLTGLLLGLGLQGLRAGIPGLTGGVAIDCWRGQRVGGAVAIGLLVGAAIDTALILSVPYLGGWTSDFGDFLASICGWAAASWVAPNSEIFRRPVLVRPVASA